ncbi:hypothetical protein G9A89_020377 [Geosiphon pyriformis]|nr:hypothetical protein G9A89_020377 [Geosiphon pyriformis]
MKEVAKNSNADSGFRPVLLRKKRKGGVLAKNVLVGRGVIETTGNYSQISETSDTTESESIDMEEECLVEETSINYGERNAFDSGNPNQTPKSSGLKIKTKKVLGKPLDKINFEDGFDDDDFLDESALLPSPLSFKPLVQVSVRKFFALDIDLVAIAGKSSQEKSNFIKKIFSSVNGFGVASTPSKFGGIIHVTFTSEKAMMATANLANECGVVVNTDLKYSGYNRTNRAIVLKEISVGTFIEAVCAAVSKFGIIKSIKMQLTVAVMLVIKGVGFYWSSLISHSLAFGGKTWALVAGSSPLGGSLGYNSQLGSLRNSKPLSSVVNNLESRLVNIESSFVSLIEQISELAKKLESFVLVVSQLSPGCQLPVTPPSQNQGEDIVMEVGSSETTSGKTAAVSGSNVSPKVVKLENMLEDLSVLVMSLSVCLDGLALAGGTLSLPLFQ